MSHILDETDIDILRALQEDSRLSLRRLAEKVHRSPTPVYDRLRRLEAEGIIRGYTLQLDFEKLGRGFMVFCNVKLRHFSTAIHDEFASAVKGMPEVIECYNVSGDKDYILKIQVPDMKSYRRFVTDGLGKLSMIDSVQSVFVMDSIKSGGMIV